MKNMATKEEFLRLRAEGLSYDAISKKINVSKPVLLKWARTFQKELNNMQFLRHQTLLEEYALTKQHRIEFFSRELQKLQKAIQSKDYSDLNSKELHALYADLMKKLFEELQDERFVTDEKVKPVLPEADLFEEKEQPVVIPLSMVT